MYAMTDMAKTPAEVAEESVPYDAKPVEITRYPYGLCISLDADDLEKLGADLDMEVGDIAMMHAIARVTSVSKREMADGKCECRVELQITHLSIDDAMTEDAAEAA